MLLGIPCVTLVVTFVVIIHNGAEEPFGILRIQDVIFQIAGPVTWLAVSD